MKQAFLVFVAATFFVLATGCASVQYAQRPSEITVDADTGLIYFYREKAFFGGGIRYAITENGTKVGVLKNGTFFVVYATPGAHTYTARTEITETVSLDVKAGETYYVRGSVGLGVFAGRPRLAEVTASEASGKLDELKFTALAR
jgi:hypothetical protein